MAENASLELRDAGIRLLWGQGGILGSLLDALTVYPDLRRRIGAAPPLLSEWGIAILGKIW